ncbi:MAG: Hpt domain-containing protein [Pseudomonadota bacterium]
MIDWDRVAQLREEVGEDDFQDVVSMFFDEVSGEIETLSAELTAQKIEVKLHFLKGAALNLGLDTFAKLCGDGESMARVGNTKDIDLDAILTCYQDTSDLFFATLSGTAAA